MERPERGWLSWGVGDRDVSVGARYSGFMALSRSEDYEDGGYRAMEGSSS